MVKWLFQAKVILLKNAKIYLEDISNRSQVLLWNDAWIVIFFHLILSLRSKNKKRHDRAVSQKMKVLKIKYFEVVFSKDKAKKCYPLFSERRMCKVFWNYYMFLNFPKGLWISNWNFTEKKLYLQISIIENVKIRKLND